MEPIRDFILLVGWPILILGSIYIVGISVRFWKNLQKGVVGRLVLGMVIGWLITMYSLGITATGYMLTDIEHGVPVVLPIFIVWFITMVVIVWSVIRWSREAETLNAFYRGLEELVKKRTGELEKTYQTKLKREREIRELREKFVSIAAHELRTPVTAIEWGLATMIEDEKLRNTIPPDYLALLKDLRTKNQNLLDLIVNILKLARARHGDLNFENEPVSIHKTIEEIKTIVEKKAEEAGVSLSWPILEQKLPDISAHPIYLKEIITNLITNAIRYNKPNGWIRMEGEAKKDTIILSITDNGIGMSKEEMKGLFKEFYRVKNEDTKNIEGTGLGLFISQQLTERMGGSIAVFSEKGAGTTFTVTLKRR